MTVYSKVQSIPVPALGRTASVSKHFSVLSAVNVFAFVAALVVLGAYIWVSNSTLSHQVVSSSLESSLRNINATSAEEASVREADMTDIVTFANLSGMIENKDVDALFAHSGVAFLNQ